MSQKALIITLVVGLVALLLLAVAGQRAALSTRAVGSGTDECRSLCEESCQGFAASGETDLCRSECAAMCAESY